MRIEDLKIFVDVVKYHSMNIAAEKNFTTPQNLSKIIKRMEDELKVTLFKRSKKGSDLTEAGERYYLKVIEVLKSYDDATLSLHDSIIADSPLDQDVEYESVSVLCTVGALSLAVMNTYNDMLAQYSKLILENDEILLSSIEDMLERIRVGRYDIIACYVSQESIPYLTDELSDYIFMHVILDEMILVVSQKNPLSQRRKVSIDEVKQLNLIYYRDFSCLPVDLIELNSHYQLRTNSHSRLIEQILKSESYCAFLFKSFCEMNKNLFDEHGGLAMLELDKKRFGTNLIAIHKECSKDKAVLQFVKLLADKF